MLTIRPGRTVNTLPNTHVLSTGRDLYLALANGHVLDLFNYKTYLIRTSNTNKVRCQLTITRATSDVAACILTTNNKAGLIETLPIGSLFTHGIHTTLYLKINDTQLINLNNRTIINYHDLSMVNYKQLHYATLDVDHRDLSPYAPLAIDNPDDFVSIYDAAIHTVLIANDIRNLSFYKFNADGTINLYGENQEGTMIQLTINRHFDALSASTVYSNFDTSYSR